MRGILDLNSVMIGTMRSKALAEFYARVIGKPADMVDAESGSHGWRVGRSYLSVLEDSEIRAIPRTRDG